MIQAIKKEAVMKKLWKTYIACGILFSILVIFVGCDNETPVLDNLPENHEEQPSVEDNNVEENHKETVIATEESLVFTDEAGDSTMTFLFQQGVLENVEWTIETGDAEVAKRLGETYQEEEYASLYQVEVNDTKVILTYTEEYVQATFDGMTKEQIELALEADGYLVSNE